MKFRYLSRNLARCECICGVKHYTNDYYYQYKALHVLSSLEKLKVEASSGGTSAKPDIFLLRISQYSYTSDCSLQILFISVDTVVVTQYQRFAS